MRSYSISVDVDVDLDDFDMEDILDYCESKGYRLRVCPEVDDCESNLDLRELLTEVLELPYMSSYEDICSTLSSRLPW